ncbi:NADP-me, partial [Micromonas pusilla CCMP1545]
IKGFRAVSKAIDKYTFLRHLRESDATSFYRVLVNHAMELLPYVYTPTVGEACQTYHRLPIRTNGVYITADDAGKVGDALRTRARDVGAGDGDGKLKVAVVTDGERILGLGDLGAGGMGIAEGKILLYTVCAGVEPAACLPVCLDVGTDNQALLDDPKYRGLRRKRLRGAAYDDLVEEFMAEMRSWQPRCLVQFEDFGNANAFRVLEKYRRVQPCFNDDIQGTACVALAALLSGLRATGGQLTDQTVLFYGAGEAGVGIGELIAMAMEKAGLSKRDAMRRCLFMDSKGLVCKARLEGYGGEKFALQPHKIPFAHDVAYQPNLLAAVDALRPTALIGVSTIAGAFDEAVVKRMAALNPRPVIMPLSNPTPLAECTFEQAVSWTNGEVVFASGSPFPPLRRAGGETLYPAQANNAYVFPALGHAAVLSNAREVSDDAFLDCAYELASMSTAECVATGKLFPDFDSIRDVSKKLVASVAAKMEARGETRERVGGIEAWVAKVEREFWCPEADDAPVARSRL